MATLKERPDNWAAGGIYLRDFRADKSTGYDETKHKKASKKVTPDKKPGCKGNNGKAHVYVWINSRFVPNEFGKHIDQTHEKWAYSRDRIQNPWYRWMPWKSKEEHAAYLEKHEIQICAGCYKKSGKRRKIEGGPVTSWYFWF